MRARRGGLAVLLTVALLLLGACGGGGSDDDAAGSSGTKGSSADGGGSDSGGDDDAPKGLPDPCSLVPLATASEILGGEAAKPESTTNDIGTASRACSWETQDAKDNPSLETAGHVLTLTLQSSPNESMSVEEYFDAASSGSKKGPDICEKTYWQGGFLNAYQKGVFLAASAGLGDSSPEGKEAVTKLITAACDSL